LPITAVRTGASLVNSAVAVLFPALLQKAGYDYTQAMQTYGVLTGMAIPVLSIPITLISGLSLVLMPELSSDFYAKNYQRLKENILRGLASAFAISCGLIPFFFALGADMGGVIYANSLSGELIANGCFLLLPMSLSMISTSILNSLGKEKFTFLVYFIGAGGMIALLWIFTPYLYEYAYLVALLFNFSFTAVCNLILLYKTLRTLSPTTSRSVKFKRKIICTLLGMAIASGAGKLGALALGKVCGVFPTLLLTAILILLICVGWFFAFIFVPRKTMPKKRIKK
jgi:stage V sporulation protein B